MCKDQTVESVTGTLTHFLIWLKKRESSASSMHRHVSPRCISCGLAYSSGIPATHALCTLVRVWEITDLLLWSSLVGTLNLGFTDPHFVCESSLLQYGNTALLGSNGL